MGIEVELTIGHLFADAGGADALVRRLESATSKPPQAEVSRPDVAVDEERAARNQNFWLGWLSECRAPAAPYCGVDRTAGHATTISVPLRPSVAAQVKELAGAARVTPATVWTAAVALMAQERCAGHEAVVCRLTCANRYTDADASAVDYRAQPIFLPLSLPMDQSSSHALRQVYRASLRAHAHGWYDALHLVEQLNRPSRGAWFLPTVELNVLQGTRGSQVVGSTVNPYSFNPSSAKADLVVGVDDRTVSVTLRGAENAALASELLERVMEWPRLLACGDARPLAELSCQHGPPDGSLLREGGVSVDRAAMRALLHGALGSEERYDVHVDPAGHVVVDSSRALTSDDALRLWCRQALVPHSVLPDRWITDGLEVAPRTLAQACLKPETGHSS
ncbi:hypothetical protein [Streptomyces sp. NBC_01363]|uniref:hypothetical protein n=1 Tax=Streptomyces sp. NBC_01363 TaxID=2903840 RepID=UPI0022564B8F|nr:hypothetical protein [Streptomyces sp. NBC_01363]MCX4734108.1 hypothetical protein [Streptomyces sp. NBC_01363]